MNYNQQVTDYCHGATEEKIIILESLRQLIHETVKNVSEEIKWRMPVFGNPKNFAYLRFSKKHVTLGFYNIHKMKDPNGLLEGEGNTLKHIKIKTQADINRKILTDWLVQVTS